MRAKESFIFVLASFLIFYYSSSAQTEIVSEGEVNPWVESANDADIRGYNPFFIGINSEGTVTISNGSKLFSRGTFLGMGESGIGSVIISGENSLWKIFAADANSPDGWVGLIHIGFNGIGRLLIQNSAMLETIGPFPGSYSKIGCNVGCNGDSTVIIENNSEWFDWGKLDINGNTIINVKNNSKITSNYIYVAGFQLDNAILDISGGSLVKANNELWLSAGEDAVSIVTISGIESKLQAGVHLTIPNWPAWGEFSAGIATLTVQDGATVVAPDINLSIGGTITGNSTIKGTLNNGGGIVSPGISIGTLTIDGKFDADDFPGSILKIEINDTGNDLLTVFGEAFLGGLLDVELLEGYQPALNEEFEILNAGSLNGTFENDNLPVFNGRSFEIIYDYENHKVKLKVIKVALNAIIDINPNTLNLKSIGNYITCYIELPESYDLNSINPSTITLTIGKNVIQAKNAPLEIGDYDSDGIDDLKVKFDRKLVQDACATTGLTEMILNLVTDEGVAFQGSDSVMVID